MEESFDGKIGESSKDYVIKSRRVLALMAGDKPAATTTQKTKVKKVLTAAACLGRRLRGAVRSAW